MTFLPVKHDVQGRNGMSKWPEYRLWSGMIQRCTNPKCEKFSYYGGRGIKVWAAWATFAVFIADVGRRPSPAHTLDRIDYNGNYEPGNIRWATRDVQSRNRRGVTLYGDKTAMDLARERGMKHQTVRYRLLHGVPLDKKVGNGTYIEYNGQTMNLGQWADLLGIDRHTIRERFRRGMPIDKVLAGRLLQ